MTKVRYFILFSLAILSISLNIYALDSYVDDFTRADSHLPVVYTGFSKSISDFRTFSAASWITDSSVINLAVPSKTGTADYYIQGAETLELEIYSMRGTYASMENGIWRLGSKESVSYENIVRCYYDSQKDMPFFEKGGAVYALRLYQGNYVFVETEEQYAKDQFYGVNISGSSDGTSFQPITTIRCEITASGEKYIREAYTVSLPQGIKVIRISLTDCVTFKEITGPLHKNDQSAAMVLGRLTISGDRLEYEKPGASSSQSPSSSQWPQESSSSFEATNSENFATKEKTGSSNNKATHTVTREYDVTGKEPAGQWEAGMRGSAGMRRTQVLENVSASSSSTSVSISQTPPDRAAAESQPQEDESKENGGAFAAAAMGAVGILLLAAVLSRKK
ncbi:hypothetical protein [Youxingia wuxianensis]|uniref:Uncharacterized protein n=1 Tax=Youxingia wuxianensis TaxID=2763678 RepID=A0A926EKC0_9FIRM|nr:hypothetical protein [Youxingia wuxianensis]MBC8584973.1 hypothetical protein [Youxingia wuxianensis]